MGMVTVPEDETQALAQVRNGLQFLARLDPLEMSAGQREKVLDGLEQADAIEAAVRGRVLVVSGHLLDCQGFGYQNEKALMVHGHRIDKKTADAHLADAVIARDWPALTGALIEGDVLSRAYVQALRPELARLPEDARARAEEILIQAARDGADLRMLQALLAEILALVVPPDPEEDNDKLADRYVTIQTTMDGAGLLRGWLSPVCTAMLQALIGSLNARTGPEDTRTQGARDHDAVKEAARRLLASGCLPQRNGQPVRALVHIGFAQLCQLQGAREWIQAWIAGSLVQRAAYHAANAVAGGDGGTWLTDAEVPGVLGDAMIIPVVTADADPAALDLLIQLCIQYGKARDAAAADADGTDADADGDGEAADGEAAAARDAQLLAMLEEGILAQVIAVVSGPGGIASLLRTQLAGQGLNGPSLMLDVGETRTIPPHLRRLVTLRDGGTCAWPGGCSRPALGCEPHHVIHLEDGGHTSLINLSDLCGFHHHYVLHKLGWTYRLNPDGTTQATTPQGEVIRSHSPPRRWKPSPG